MKVTKQLLKDIGLQEWLSGTELAVPSFCKKDIDLLYQTEKSIIAIMSHRYLNDHRIHARIMIVLNQLVRYYRCPITLYCLSYRAVCCREKIYMVFKKTPSDKEN